MNYSKKGLRQKQRRLSAKSNKNKHRANVSGLKIFFLVGIGLAACVIGLGLGAYKGILACTPKIRLSDVVAVGEATIIYDKEGNTIDQYVSMNSNRIQINDMDLIPKHLGQAFVAIEDERFYEHNGIDLMGIVRAGWQFLKTGGQETQGGSTITQQLLKNTIFTEWTSEGDNWIKKIKRKIQEQYLALEISKYYSKDDVLLRYMNAINLGQNTLGVESASLRYFGKSCSELTLSESAVIACITQNPYGYNPIRFPEKNAERRERCLTNMLKLGFINQSEYDEAIADTDAVYERIGSFDIDFRSNENSTAGSYFSDAVYEVVRDDLMHEAGYSDNLAESLLTSGGLRIYSTMDPTIQRIANEEFANPENYPEKVKWYLNYALSVYLPDDTVKNFSKENMMSWFKKHEDNSFNLIFSSQEEAMEAVEFYRTAMMEDLGVEIKEDNYVEKISMTAQPQAAMVISDQKTGYVLAMVGGRGVKEGRRTFNRATTATRSPGSTFKVLAAYAPALDSNGMTLANVFNDAPFNYEDGTPVNNWYDTGYRGIQNFRQGIAESLNIIAVKTLTVVTPRLGYEYLENFGFTSLVENEVKSDGKRYTDMKQPLALGGLTNGVSPLELNAAYAAIANEGYYNTPKLYTVVTDADGNIILDRREDRERSVIKDTTAYLLTDAMEDVVKTPAGTGTRCNFDPGMGIAGKTGSSSDYVDVWFAGFTPYYTCTTWAGYDNNVHMDTSNANKETRVAQTLWRAIMKRVHEELPQKTFEQPEGIVEAVVCSRSGKLPIPGICDATLKTEIFEDGTVPMDYCNVHYQGVLCHHDLLPATDECPFKIDASIELPLLEDPLLHEGSTVITENEDGTQTVSKPRTTEKCQHDAAFFANPDVDSLINQQRWEIQWRNDAAQGQ